MKTTIKKLLCMVMISMMAIASLVACGSKSSGGSASAKGVNIYFSIPDLDDTFRATLADAIQSAADSSGANLTMEFCGTNTDDQLKMIEAAASSGQYDAIICRLIDASTALQMEVAAGDLPVIFVNNEPDSDYLKADQYVYVGSYEQDAGSFQAEYVWNKLGKPSSLNVIIMEGEQGHSGAIGRTNAVKYFFRDNGVDAHIVFMDYANWSDTQAYDKLQIFKMTNQSFDCIICNNDTMALGAVKWLQDNGYDTSKYPVAGVDATADGCASVKAGGMYMTVLQDAASQGAAAVSACGALAKGQSVSTVEGATEDLKYIFVPFVPVDASNVDDFM
ncbi:MAG: substrate-binding domain-containing protein [Pseudobutyrivibrio sp.]|nr:substrate-binding domain-containing protein [Pseudobutyrivibrio sp.]